MSSVIMADDVLFEFLHMEIVSHVYKEQASREDIDKDRVTCVSILEGMGFRVGQGLIERCTKDYPTFKDDLDIMKFLCKDFWTSIFRKQIDNLRTNHQGTYVLQDNKFALLTQVSSGKQHLEEAPKLALTVLPGDTKKTSFEGADCKMEKERENKERITEETGLRKHTQCTKSTVKPNKLREPLLSVNLKKDVAEYLAYSCGLIRGALSNLGLESVVTAEVSLMPSCKFQVVIQKT